MWKKRKEKYVEESPRPRRLYEFLYNLRNILQEFLILTLYQFNKIHWNVLLFARRKYS